MNIIDELEDLATSIYHVSSVLVHFHFYFQNKIIFLGNPPVYSGKSPPPPTLIQTPLCYLYTH